MSQPRALKCVHSLKHIVDSHHKCLTESVTSLAQIIGSLHIYGQTLVIHAVEGSLGKLNILNNNVFDFLGICEIIKPNMTI